MAANRAYIKQVSPDVGADTDSPVIYQNRDHATYINSREGLVDQWTRDGRVFMTANATPGTTVGGSANGTAITATAPSFRYTIPAGLTVVPILFSAYVATVIAKSDIFQVIVSDTDTYSSGGLAGQPVRNALMESNNALRSSQVTNVFNSGTTLVEAALTRPRQLKQMKRQGQTAELQTTWNPEFNMLNHDPLLYITGPASFLVWVLQQTTLAQFEYTAMWAELPTSIVSHP